MAIKKIRYDFNLPWLGVYTTDTSKPTDIMVKPNGTNVSSPAPDKSNDASVADPNRTQEVTQAKQELREHYWTSVEDDLGGVSPTKLVIGNKPLSDWVDWFHKYVGIDDLKMSQYYWFARQLNKATKMSPGDSIFDGIIRQGLDKFVTGYGITETDEGGTVYIKQGSPIWKLLVKFADRFLTLAPGVDINKVLPSGTEIGKDATGRSVIVK